MLRAAFRAMNVFGHCCTRDVAAAEQDEAREVPQARKPPTRSVQRRIAQDLFPEVRQPVAQTGMIAIELHNVSSSPTANTMIIAGVPGAAVEPDHHRAGAASRATWQRPPEPAEANDERLSSLESSDILGNLKPHASRLEEALNYPYEPGRHTLRSPVVGTRFDEYEAVRVAMRETPALERFIDALYRPEHTHFIPFELKHEAEAYAQQRFQQYLGKYAKTAPDLTIHNAVEIGRTFWLGKTDVYDTENAWNTWCLHARVAAEPEARNGLYLPMWVTAYHEFMHIEECLEGISAAEFNRRAKHPSSEALTALTTLMLEDEVYKHVKAIPLDQEVTYRRFLTSPTGRTVDCGHIAHFYRQLGKQHMNLAAALMSRESLQFIQMHGF